MDKQAISRRVTELANSVGTDIGVAANRCWMDGSSCAYGEPYGSFDRRPETFCVPSVCQKLRNSESELYHIIGQDPDEKDTEDYFVEHAVMFSSQLSAAADRYRKGSAEQLALELAADIIRGTEYDEKVLLEQDLPRNQMVRCSGGP